MAVATSIDATGGSGDYLCIFLQVRLLHARFSFIGMITFALSMAGVKAGNVLAAAAVFGRSFAGGVILMLMGVRILCEHLLAHGRMLTVNL